ncbi:MAG: coproporphyrinogen dehydrogenase HemZ [Christensenellaceae bacterium]|jgi:oxygen-independent coproporphyrinogen-3 oxidase|nr:coproporphyrinogen dehydrogenase HemZ [Christensenellaceae bacterium]
MKYEVRLELNIPQYMNDVQEIVRAFNPHISIVTTSNNYINLNVIESNETISVVISSNLKNSVTSNKAFSEYRKDEYKRQTKRYVKNLLYIFCKSLVDVDMPYGSLTGVRPTKLVYDAIDIKCNMQEYLMNTFYVSKDRADLICNTVKGQTGIRKYNKKAVDIFVNIPFCEGRCKYCSFISTEISGIRKRIPDYINALCTELDSITKLIDRQKLNVRSIYVGGGTPTVLTASQLEKILVVFDKYKCEFTVEAGRADSIEYDKLKLLKEVGVTRISINPQTFNDKTLLNLNRGHTVKDVYDKFSMAREFDFDINMDLIVGLMGETSADFKHSIDSILELKPENITIHTLALKRGSNYKNSGLLKETDGMALESTNCANKLLSKKGYFPYYLYRQKNTADNLENVGYTVPEKACLYNVDYMEETISCLATGAGAMSKIIFVDENRIERFHNPKGFNDYLDRYYECIERHEKLINLVANQ